VKNEKVVMFDSPEAAELKTVTGWVSRDGRFYGDDERIARYAGCTHRKCEQCEAVVDKSRIICGACHNKAMNAKYAALEAKEWDGDTPLALFDDDTYFFDWESVEDYCDTHDCKIEDLQLVICTPVKPALLSADEMFCDFLPEDGESPDEVKDAVEAVNKAIIASAPFSWYPGKFRAVFAHESSENERAKNGTDCVA